MTAVSDAAIAAAAKAWTHASACENPSCTRSDHVPAALSGAERDKAVARVCLEAALPHLDGCVGELSKQASDLGTENIRIATELRDARQRVAELEALLAQAEDHAAEYAGLPEITAVQRIDLKPGDHLVLTTSAADISDEQFETMAERVRRWAGFALPVLVLVDGWTIDLIGPPAPQPLMCDPCAHTWRNGSPLSAPAVVIWTCKPSGNRVPLCASCLEHWQHNAEGDPELAAASIEPIDLIGPPEQT